MIAQLELGLPGPKRTPPDYRAEARAELTAALDLAAAAIDAPPWDKRQQDYWRTVFPQMAGWLPVMEREQLVARFLAELDRLEPMFGAAS